MYRKTLRMVYELNMKIVKFILNMNVKIYNKGCIGPLPFEEVAFILSERSKYEE